MTEKEARRLFFFFSTVTTVLLVGICGLKTTVLGTWLSQIGLVTLTSFAWALGLSLIIGAAITAGVRAFVPWFKRE